MADMRAEEAARRLAEIEARQGRAVRRALVPRWYWWAVGTGMVALGAVVDTQGRSLVVVAAVLFAIAVAALSVWAIAGGLTGARARRDLLGPEGALGIVLLDFVVVGESIGVAFAARWLGWPFPATIGTACGALLLVVGGPRLMTGLEGLMRDRAGR